MEHSEQENIELRGTVTTLQEKLESLTTLVDSLMAAQNPQPPPNSQAIVTSEVTTPVSTVAFSIPSFSMQEGWGTPFSFGAGFRHNFSEVQTTTTEAPATQGSVFSPHPGVTFSQITMALSQPTMIVPISVTLWKISKNSSTR